MSFIFKQMLNNINTYIDILNEQITYSGKIDDMLWFKIGINKELAETERIRSVAADQEHALEITRLTDEVNQLHLDNIHYGFRVLVCGTTYQNCNNGNILVFDNKTRTDYGWHVMPDATAYNTSTYKYTVPVDGNYFFGFKLFMNSGPNDADRRFGIYVNNSVYAFGGAYIGTGENVSLN